VKVGGPWGRHFEAGRASDEFLPWEHWPGSRSAAVYCSETNGLHHKEELHFPCRCVYLGLFGGCDLPQVHAICLSSLISSYKSLEVPGMASCPMGLEAKSRLLPSGYQDPPPTRPKRRGSTQ
jgi:hypothetical protein